MFDVEFLVSSRNSFKHLVVYEYNTAVFKPDVCSKVEDVFEFRGLLLDKVDCANLNQSIRGSSLFGNFLMVFDLNEYVLSNKGWEKEFESFSKDVLSGILENRFLILCREGKEVSKLKSMQSYIDLTKNSTYLVESEFSKTSMNKIVKYLILKNKNIFDFNKLKNQDIFLKSLHRYFECSENSLVDFIKFFERTVILCVEGDIFKLDLFNKFFQNKEVKNYYVLYKLVYNFLVNTSETTRSILFKHMCDLYLKQKCSVRLIVYRLTQIMKEFFFLCGSLNESEEYFLSLTGYKKFRLEKFKNIPVKPLLRFSVLLTQYEEKFNSKDFILELNSFLSEYIKKGR